MNYVIQTLLITMFLFLPVIAIGMALSVTHRRTRRIKKEYMASLEKEFDYKDYEMREFVYQVEIGTIKEPHMIVCHNTLQ